MDAYLREEVQAEALVRDIGGYARLLDLVAASSGRVVNLHTLILFRIPAWSGSDRASLVAHPKLLLFDLGVRNAILRRPLDRPLDDERGLLLEHLVGFLAVPTAYRLPPIALPPYRLSSPIATLGEFCPLTPRLLVF